MIGAWERKTGLNVEFTKMLYVCFWIQVRYLFSGQNFSDDNDQVSI